MMANRRLRKSAQVAVTPGLGDYAVAVTPHGEEVS